MLSIPQELFGLGSHNNCPTLFSHLSLVDLELDPEIANLDSHSKPRQHRYERYQRRQNRLLPRPTRINDLAYRPPKTKFHGPNKTSNKYKRKTSTPK